MYTISEICFSRPVLNLGRSNSFECTKQHRGAQYEQLQIVCHQRWSVDAHAFLLLIRYINNKVHDITKYCDSINRRIFEDNALKRAKPIYEDVWRLYLLEKRINGAKHPLYCKQNFPIHSEQKFVRLYFLRSYFPNKVYLLYTICNTYKTIKVLIQFYYYFSLLKNHLPCTR